MLSKLVSTLARGIRDESKPMKGRNGILIMADGIQVTVQIDELLYPYVLIVSAISGDGEGMSKDGMVTKYTLPCWSLQELHYARVALEYKLTDSVKKTLALASIGQATSGSNIPSRTCVKNQNAYLERRFEIVGGASRGCLDRNIYMDNNFKRVATSYNKFSHRGHKLRECHHINRYVVSSLAFDSDELKTMVISPHYTMLVMDTLMTRAIQTADLQRFARGSQVKYDWRKFEQDVHRILGCVNSTKADAEVRVTAGSCICKLHPNKPPTSEHLLLPTILPTLTESGTEIYDTIPMVDITTFDPKRNKYYVAVKKNQDTLDAVMTGTTTAFIVQITTGDTHGIKVQAMVDVWEKLRDADFTQVFFLFVTNGKEKCLKEGKYQYPPNATQATKNALDESITDIENAAGHFQHRLVLENVTYERLLFKLNLDSTLQK
jgi:hypothetical protein